MFILNIKALHYTIIKMFMFELELFNTVNLYFILLCFYFYFGSFLVVFEYLTSH